ncbi:MAG: HAD-IIA family hydrolase [Kiritimatiellia bacterium]|jgi:NagD protein
MNSIATPKRGVICDMDGVLYHGNHLLPGAREFIEWLEAEGMRFLFLTNSSERSPRELSEKLHRLGLDVAEEHFLTSAMATASFLASQRPGGTAYVIGQPALINAIYEAGYSMNEVNPDYVVVGETPSYTYASMKKAVNLLLGGARLIGTNPDVTGPVENGIVPACGSLVAPIEMAAGVKAYFVGKPNPIIMRAGLQLLGCRREETLVVGDRMDTDIVAGVESGIETVLVLSGVTSESDVRHFGYGPSRIVPGIGDVPSLVTVAK